MHTLPDANNTFVHLLQSLAVLLSEHPEDAELDGKTAPQCDEELSALRSVQKALERRVALVSNTFAPINSLPPELLVNIFAIATSSIWGAVSSDNATLMLVCRYWNRLVDTTPSFWTKIHADAMSMAKITQAMKKSQNAALDIICNSWVLERAKRDAFLNVILPHAHRWREVNLALGEGDQGLPEAIAALSTPLLESLSLSVDGYYEWVSEEPPNLFGGRPSPRLQKLFLEGIPVPWSPVILCHLTALSISRIRHLGPSLDQVLTVLTACPDLESLSIFEVSFSGGVGTSSPNSVHMPALATLELRRLTTEVTNRLLASIDAPNCISGALDCDVPDDPLQTLFTPDVSHFFDRIRSNPCACSITLDSSRVTINLMEPWFITINVENITFVKDTLIWLSPQSRIQLIISGLNLPLDELLTVAADMEAVDGIALYAYQVSRMLTLLATCRLVQGRTGWLFPGLVEMSIGSYIVSDDLEKLLLILRVRNEGPETQDNAQQPKPLRKLGIGSPRYVGADEPVIADFSSIYWPNHLNEIRRLLGPEGELIWYGKIVTEEGVLEDRILSEGGSY